VAEEVRAAPSDLVGSQILSKYEELKLEMEVWFSKHKEPSRVISYFWPRESVGLLAKRTMNIIHFLNFLGEEYPEPPNLILGYREKSQ
jgi:hypothetical protein